jgi:hypothetical protein
MLQHQEQQLEEQLATLAVEQSKVDEAAVHQDRQALKALAAAHQEVQQLVQQHQQAVAAHEQLLDERYIRLISVLQSLNTTLDAVYKQLTGGGGSAYCAYTQVCWRMGHMQAAIPCGHGIKTGRKNVMCRGGGGGGCCLLGTDCKLVTASFQCSKLPAQECACRTSLLTALPSTCCAVR